MYLEAMCSVYHILLWNIEYKGYFVQTQTETSKIFLIIIYKIHLDYFCSDEAQMHNTIWPIRL